jgi:oxygen-independent coproporphyrinogen III oxidase
MSVIREPFSLYIHIPYCISKCPYCDFNSHVVSVIPEEAYSRALLQELDAYASAEHWRDRTMQSIFFGGGTPSTFMPQTIGKILDHVAHKFTLQSGCEITLEANPGTVDSAKFAGYRNAGVNRISVGIQSFQPRLLKFLGRVHTAAEGRKALEVVRQAGFENFSFDLIFANPEQTLGELEADLEIAIDYRSPHLSAYNLTFEEGTPFYHEYRCGRMATLTEDEEIAMAELIEAKLRRAGLLRYEISNYALPGRHSRHNVNYWQSGDYLGVGAGAHSYIRVAAGLPSGKRWSNEKTPGRYMARVSETSTAVAEQENIDAIKSAGEFLFLGLRMTAGISLQTFSHRFGRSPVDFYPKIKSWREAGLMEEKNGMLRLTAKGLLLANSIFVEFV